MQRVLFRDRVLFVATDSLSVHVLFSSDSTHSSNGLSRVHIPSAELPFGVVDLVIDLLESKYHQKSSNGVNDAKKKNRD
jgi:hypothetical protein